MKKYERWYNNIISKAKNENREKHKFIYYEEHHIMPKSMGGDNSEKNLVLLTGREHFLCHFMMTKFVDEKYRLKAYMAFNCMTQNLTNRYCNAKLYNSTKAEFSNRLKNHNFQNGKRNSNYNLKWIKFDKLKIQMKIKLSEIHNYIDQGWTLGRIMSYTSITHIRNKEAKINNKKKRLEEIRKIYIKKYTNVYNFYKLSNFKYFSEFCRYHQINYVNYGTKIRKLFNIKSL